MVCTKPFLRASFLFSETGGDFFQRLFLYSRHIGTGYAKHGGDFPLCHFLAAADCVSQPDYFPLTFVKHLVYLTHHTGYVDLVAYLVGNGIIVRLNHIHNRYLVAVKVVAYGILQKNIVAVFF